MRGLVQDVTIPALGMAMTGAVLGAYSPYFWVESDRAMAGGREFHGQPKRIAEVTLEAARPSGSSPRAT